MLFEQHSIQHDHDQTRELNDLSLHLGVTVKGLQHMTESGSRHLVLSLSPPPNDTSK